MLKKFFPLVLCLAFLGVIVRFHAHLQIALEYAKPNDSDVPNVVD